MQIDFWQISRDPAEKVVAMIAHRLRSGGDRLLVVSKDAEQRRAISEALWQSYPTDFLAHGFAGEGHDSRQPILIADALPPQPPANGARQVVLADGEWRSDASGYERAFMLFDEDSRAAARKAWAELGKADSGEPDGVEQTGAGLGAEVNRRYFAQEHGKWVRKA